MYFYNNKINEINEILPNQCENCGMEEDNFGICPYEECENQQLLCSDCLFIYIEEHSIDI